MKPIAGIAVATTALLLAACAPTSKIALPESAPGEVLYVIDPGHTFPHFEVTHLGWSTHRGRFNKTSGWIVLDRTARRGKLELVIDTDSLDTGDPALEQRLREQDFFDATNHPTITYRADRFRFDGETVVGVDGELTIRGVTRPVTLTVSSFRCGPLPIIRREACAANAETRIARADFGISLYPSMIGTDIRLLIQVEAHRR
jgi:polyisoprenoid-binding protein YceI